VSWEARFLLTSDFLGWPSVSLTDFGCVGAQSFYHTCEEFGTLPAYFVATVKMVCLHYIIPEMGSFPWSVAYNFCD
jgi:hypothetical protein